MRTSSPSSSRRTATPRSSASGSTGPDGATTRTTSPGRRGAGKIKPPQDSAAGAGARGGRAGSRAPHALPGDPPIRCTFLIDTYAGAFLLTFSLSFRPGARNERQAPHPRRRSLLPVRGGRRERARQGLGHARTAREGGPGRLLGRGGGGARVVQAVGQGPRRLEQALLQVVRRRADEHRPQLPRPPPEDLAKEQALAG